MWGTINTYALPPKEVSMLGYGVCAVIGFGLLVASACSDDASAPAQAATARPPTGSGTGEPGTQVASVSAGTTRSLTGNWTVEPGTRVASASAPATLVLPDGSYRMYLPGLETRSSRDGLTWSAPQRLALTEPGEFLRNPAVVRHKDGTYVMIYEGVKDERLPSRVTRFYRAVSSDGVAFAKTAGKGAHGAVLEPGDGDGSFLSAPDMLALPDGSLRLYFNTADGARVESAVSKDDGLTWTREGAVTIAGLGAGIKAADPDVLRMADGTFRLFFAAGDSGKPNPRIVSATSSDGRSFTLDSGERLTPADSATFLEDPEVVLLPSGDYRLYFAEAASADAPRSLKSAILRGP
jgi:hypothetical protein